MTDTNWMNAWLDAQQGYWQSWSDLAKRGTQAPAAAKNPWSDAVDQWWKGVAPMASGDGREVFDRLMDVSRGYFSLGERFFSQGQNSAEPGMDAVNGWLDGMQKMWGDWLKSGGQFRPEAMGQGFSTFWDVPLDAWQKLAANVMPGDHAYHPDNFGQPMRDQFSRFMAMPAVGYTRESQEQFKQLGQRQMDYAVAMQAYQTSFGKLAMETTRKFQEQMKKRVEEGSTISSLRELYDQWVEMSEAAYAEFVMTQEYQALYGQLVNSLLGLKKQSLQLLDQGLESMHMPSQREVRGLQSRQQEMRRENHALKKELKSLQQQINELRDELRASQKPVKPAAPAEVAPAKVVKAAKPVAPAKKPAAGKSK